MAVFFKDANGNFFTSVKAGVGAPEGFEPVEANSVDAAQEKHVPRSSSSATATSSTCAWARSSTP